MWLAAVRDVAIVLLAIESLFIGIILVVFLSQLRKLMKMLREEIAPILKSANETVSSVQGTTQFVSHSIVEPLVKVSSYSAGTIQALRSLLFIGRRVGQSRRSGQVVDVPPIHSEGDSLHL